MQTTALRSAFHHRVEMRLDDGALALVDAGDDVFADIDPGDMQAFAGENGGKRQAHIAQSDDGGVGGLIGCFWRRRQRGGWFTKNFNICHDGPLCMAFDDGN